MRSAALASRAVEATARFAEIVQGADPPLDEGALLIAAHARPGLDVEGERSRLDALARGCSSATLEGLRQYLFEELGFCGNVDDYHDPANSYLDVVLERRTGIPITLSVVAIEVGRRVGVHLGGVGMPGHFLVRSLDGPELYVDPFGGGGFLGPPECEDLFHRVVGADADFRSEYLEVVDNRSLLWRMLNNLRQVFAARGELRRLSWVLELQLTFPDPPAPERHRLAALLGAAGRLDRAADALELAAGDLDGDAASKARRQARVLRSRLN